MSPLQDLVTPARLALVVGLVLGGVGVGVAGTPLPRLTPQTVDTASEEVVSEAETTHPFLLETIGFRATPGAQHLLGGSSTQAHAVAILSHPCNRGDADLPPLFLVPSTFARSTDATSVLPAVRTQRLATGDAERSQPACPVLLTVDVSVTSAPGGYVLADVPAETLPADQSTAEPLTDAVLMPYTLTLYMGTDAYWLLLVSAALVATASTAWLGHRPSSHENALAVTKGDGAPGPSYPVMAGIAAVLTAVSGTTINWSELVPTLHLGGITVVGLVSAVLVAIGESVVRRRGEDSPTPLLGHFLRVLGTAVLALLPPLILLYGATIGAWSVGVWTGLIVALGGVSMLALPEGPRASSRSRDSAGEKVAES